MSITEKTCSKCKILKSTDNFRVRKDRPSGYFSACKVCTADGENRTSREWYQKNKEYRCAQIALKRRENPELVKEWARNWRRKNSEKVNQRHEENKKNHPEKTECRRLFRNAVDSGRVVAQPCEKCGAKGEGHHSDYTKPYEVTWLCRKHHMELHRKYSNEDLNEMVNKSLAIG